jgi:hypothetical protein
MRNAFVLSVAMMVTGCVGQQAQPVTSMPLLPTDGRAIGGGMPNLISISAGQFDIGAGYVTAAYLIDRPTNLCYFWTTTTGVTTSGVLIDCCRLRKIPAALAVLQTMSESCGDNASPTSATPTTSAGAGG